MLEDLTKDYPTYLTTTYRDPTYPTLSNQLYFHNLSNSNLFNYFHIHISCSISLLILLLNTRDIASFNYLLIIWKVLAYFWYCSLTRIFV